MAKQFNELNDSLVRFIEAQHIFFVATARSTGTVNLSPKGMASLRVLDSTKVVWLNLTGSGNESAAHILENSRMTLMFCSFEKKPLILRLYGHAKAIHPRDERWSEYLAMFPEDVGARQFFEVDIDLVQTSCGFAVPFYEFKEDRTFLSKDAENKGREAIEQYWEDRNQVSIDGFETNILG